MRVTLLGTGDTTGTPTVGCDCETCLAARERGIERTRFSVHVENERTGESLLVDFSPDFRHQFLTRDVPLPDEALVTHIHFDHLDGLGNAYRLFDDLPVYAADETDPATESARRRVVRTRRCPVDDRSLSSPWSCPLHRTWQRTPVRSRSVFSFSMSTDRKPEPI